MSDDFFDQLNASANDHLGFNTAIIGLHAVKQRAEQQRLSTENNQIQRDLLHAEYTRAKTEKERLNIERQRMKLEEERNGLLERQAQQAEAVKQAEG